MTRRRHVQDERAPRTRPLPGESLPVPTAAAWVAEALCAQADPEAWFPESGRNDLVAAAKRVCSACPVRTECLEASIDEAWGIWAGVTERQRRKRRQLRRARDQGAA